MILIARIESASQSTLAVLVSYRKDARALALLRDLADDKNPRVTGVAADFLGQCGRGSLLDPTDQGQ